MAAGRERRPIEDRAEGPAREQLHHEVGVPASVVLRGAEVVDGDDARVGQAAGGRGFTGEAGHLPLVFPA